METFPAAAQKHPFHATQHQAPETSSALDPAAVPHARSATTSSSMSRKSRSSNVSPRLARRLTGSHDDDTGTTSTERQEVGHIRHGGKGQARGSTIVVPGSEAIPGQATQRKKLLDKAATNRSGGVNRATENQSSPQTLDDQSETLDSPQPQHMSDSATDDPARAITYTARDALAQLDGGSQSRPGTFLNKAAATYNSTTDDEGSTRLTASFPQPLSADLGKNRVEVQSVSSSESSATLPAALQRFRPSGRSRSPLAGPQLSELVSTQEEWDYAETEMWGWIILVATWVVFVVGMGSCFDVWSWAWDVGQTPYAPPELEDDATLPIVGYYPALMVLTGVVSWIWVLVAWMGMKYFKHAKMPSEDT